MPKPYSNTLYVYIIIILFIFLIYKFYNVDVKNNYYFMTILFKFCGIRLLEVTYKKIV